MNVTLEFKRVSGNTNTGTYALEYSVLIDNVSLIVKAEAKPEQIELKMNDQPVSDIDWGNGTVGQIDSWTITPVDVKFDTSEVRPPEMGGYEVEFKTDLNPKNQFLAPFLLGLFHYTSTMIIRILDDHLFPCLYLIWKFTLFTS